MRSKYGQVCAKHPDLNGRRYVPSNGCIKCHNEDTRARAAHKRELIAELIKAAIEARTYSKRLDAALVGLGYE